MGFNLYYVHIGAPTWNTGKSFLLCLQGFFRWYFQILVITLKLIFIAENITRMLAP